MKVSKETKILAVLLALFLLIGIGCGAAVATHESENMIINVVPLGAWAWISADEASGLTENMVSASLAGTGLMGTSASENLAMGLAALAEAHAEISLEEAAE